MPTRASRRHIEPVKCSAHSVRTGAPCKNYAIVGTNVCNKHGAAAPQTKRAALAVVEQKKIEYRAARLGTKIETVSGQQLLKDAVQRAAATLQVTGNLLEQADPNNLDANILAVYNRHVVDAAKIGKMSLDAETMQIETADLVLNETFNILGMVLMSAQKELTFLSYEQQNEFLKYLVTEFNRLATQRGVLGTVAKGTKFNDI